MTTAASIIDFIARLHGMDRLQRIDITDQRPGAFDILTAQAIEPSSKFPEGDMLAIERFDGRIVLVHTHILVDALILRTAQAYSSREAGGLSVKEHYLQLKEHLQVKTGFSY